MEMDWKTKRLLQPRSALSSVVLSSYFYWESCTTMSCIMKILTQIKNKEKKAQAEMEVCLRMELGLRVQTVQEERTISW